MLHADGNVMFVKNSLNARAMKVARVFIGKIHQFLAPPATLPTLHTRLVYIGCIENYFNASHAQIPFDPPQLAPGLLQRIDVACEQ